MSLLNLIILLLLTSTAAHCPDPSWIVDDDRIDGVVSKEGQPLKHARVQLSSPMHEYHTMTDDKGEFLIEGVAVGKYLFVVKGWGKAHLDVRGWHRGAINRPVLLFNTIRRCLNLGLVAK